MALYFILCLLICGITSECLARKERKFNPEHYYFYWIKYFIWNYFQLYSLA